MSKLYILTNYIFMKSNKERLYTCLGMVSIEIAALFITAFSEFNAFMPYEILIKKSGVPIIFSITALIVYFIDINACEECYKKNKSIYTLMTLPIPRWNLYFAYVVAGVISLIVILAVQLLTIVMLYIPVMSVADTISKGVPVFIESSNTFINYGSKMNNGLFLAFIRSSFLSTIMPFNIRGWIILITFILIIVVIGNYLILVGRSKFSFGIFGYIAITNLCVNVNNMNNQYEVQYFIMCMTLAIICLWFWIRKSIEVLNASENI